MTRSGIHLERLILVIVHVDLLIDSAKAEVVCNDEGIDIIVFRKIGISIPELFDLFGIEHIQVPVKPSKTAAFPEKSHEIITVNGCGFHANHNLWNVLQ